MLWGSSLCWWANIEYPPDVKSKLLELLFGETGLKLTVLRYNLGGGNDPNLKQSMREGALMPCICNQNKEFNLENDKKQLDILDNAVKMSVNHVELFCNSPPYWMTKSGLTNGSTKGFVCNLKWSSIDEFADFLIESYELLKSRYAHEMPQRTDGTNGIIVSIEPFNEPSNPYWLSTGNQEGCYYDYFTRRKLISTLKRKKPDLFLAASDEFSAGFALLWWIFSPKHLVNRFNLHSYKLDFVPFSRRINLPDDYDIVRKCFRWLLNKTPLWMSEFGMGGPNNLENALALGRHIFRDLKLLKPEAWIYWQVVENMSDNGWGLIQINFNNPHEIVIQWQYYVFMHFTRTLEENDTYEIITDYMCKITKKNGTIAYILLNDTKETIYLKDIIILHQNKIFITDKNNKYKEMGLDQPMSSCIYSIPPMTIMSTSMTILVNDLI